jgi:hypothetical protein
MALAESCMNESGFIGIYLFVANWIKRLGFGIFIQSFS